MTAYQEGYLYPKQCNTHQLIAPLTQKNFFKKETNAPDIILKQTNKKHSLKRNQNPIVSHPPQDTLKQFAVGSPLANSTWLYPQKDYVTNHRVEALQ